jgi:putative oxygen-independent coproporphyrinogen III oxidase
MSKEEYAGLYVHVPFCRTRCAYCDFYSQTDLSLASGWLKALKREVRLYKDRFAPFDSLYVGGGTPTLLTAAQFEELADCLFKSLPFAPEIEFTVEANPDDVKKETLALLRNLGVNRLSLGVQSLNDEELSFLKRRHSAHQAEEALGGIRKAGFKSLSADLIYGLPGQSLSSWLKSLARILTFNPDHLSCYELTLEKNTFLGRMLAEGKIRKIAEKAEREFFLNTSLFLEEKGYMHYEVSNFARPGRFCRHNLKYWQHVPYLGLGPSAHSYRDGVRWWNHRSVETYCLALGQGLTAVAGAETLSENQYHLERMMLGFRTSQGVSLDEIRACHQADSILRQLIDSRLVVLKGDRIHPTLDGYLVADSLPLLLAG